MGIYYFAVDYKAKQKIEAPKGFNPKSNWQPWHPLPNMIAMMNYYGSDFRIVNDVSTYEEHGFEDITEKVYEKWKAQTPNFDWEEYEK